MQALVTIFFWFFWSRTKLYIRHKTLYLSWIRKKNHHFHHRSSLGRNERSFCNILGPELPVIYQLLDFGSGFRPTSLLMVSGHCRSLLPLLTFLLGRGQKTQKVNYSQPISWVNLFHSEGIEWEPAHHQRQIWKDPFLLKISSLSSDR